MKPIVKGILSPDEPDLATYSPPESDDFGFLLQLLIGPENADGMESFQVVVCTPKWLSKKHHQSEIVIGRHHLIVFEYDYNRLMAFVRSYVSQCAGENWKEIALKLARFGHWEFEDYVP